MKTLNEYHSEVKKILKKLGYDSPPIVWSEVQRQFNLNVSTEDCARQIAHEIDGWQYLYGDRDYPFDDSVETIPSTSEVLKTIHDKMTLDEMDFHLKNAFKK